MIKLFKMINIANSLINQILLKHVLYYIIIYKKYKYLYSNIFYKYYKEISRLI